MGYVITTDCIACGMCSNECPNSAIYFDNNKYFITSICQECGNCVDICPVNAIKVDYQD